MRGRDSLRESIKDLIGLGMTDDQILSAVAPTLYREAASTLHRVRNAKGARKSA
jgi:hypothetical protein